MDSTQDLILAELRELRGEYNTHSRETGERLATVETQMYSLCGNGQPGRISNLETAVQKLKEWRWWVLGAMAGGTTVTTAVAWIIVAWKR
jgi:hypothetical protein